MQDGNRDENAKCDKCGTSFSIIRALLLISVAMNLIKRINWTLNWSFLVASTTHMLLSMAVNI